MEELDKTKADFQYVKSGLLSEMKDLIINHRFEIGKLYHNGVNSCVYECKDITKQIRKQKLVIKIFKDDAQLMNEAKTLKTLRKIQKQKYGDKASVLVP